MSKNSEYGDLVNRSDKSPDPYGTMMFVLGRSFDPLLQYGILSGLGASLIAKLGGSYVHNLYQPGEVLKLSNHRKIILVMSAAAALKQIYWKIFIGQEHLGFGNSLMICVYNSVLNSLNSLAAIWAFTSPNVNPERPFTSLSVIVGTSLFTVGLLSEWISEIQRLRFKKNPKNKGKPYSGGLFSLARSINYGSYAVWRGAYSLVAGGWAFAAFIFGFNFRDFASRAEPNMDQYCQKRYGEQWTDVKRKVPYRLIPYIY